MSPKSRGRPPGRGRSARRAHRPHHEPSLAQIVVREAAELDGADAVTARVVASSWLGRAWAAAPLGDRDPESTLVNQLLLRAGRAPAGAAGIALQALATITQPPWGETVGTFLTELPDVGRQPWTDGLQGPPAAVSARRYTDPWESQIAYLVRYAVPEDHSLLVSYTTDFGLMADGISVGVQDGDEPPVGDLNGDPHDPAEALADIAEVLEMTDMLWPRQTEGDYADLRALAHWYAAPHHRGPREFVPISDEDRLSLIQDFLESCGLSREDRESRDGMLADLFIDYADGYLPGGVLAWSPGAAARFMLDWVHRKTILPPEDLEALPETLAAWVGFVLARKGLDHADIAEVIDAVHDCTEDFAELAGDDDLAGPAKQLAMRAMAAGVDPRDKDAMAEIVGAYNAEQNARALLDEPGP